MKTSHLSKSVRYLLPLLAQRSFNYSQLSHIHCSTSQSNMYATSDAAHRRLRQQMNIPHEFADQNLITSDTKDAKEHFQCFLFTCQET